MINSLKTFQVLKDNNAILQNIDFYFALYFAETIAQSSINCHYGYL
jgi:hypothetical protein